MEQLTHSEEIVMMIIWKSEDLIGNNDIIEQAQNYESDWKRQTVSTFLLHLREKGYVSMIKQGTRVFYKPLVNMEIYRRQVLDEMLNLWYDGDAVGFVSDVYNGIKDEREQDYHSEPDMDVSRIGDTKEYLIEKISSVISNADAKQLYDILNFIEADSMNLKLLKNAPEYILTCDNCMKFYGKCPEEKEIFAPDEEKQMNLCEWRFKRFYRMK